MKTICIYHSRDLDGWMSAAIVKKWYGFATNNYEDKHKVIKEGGDQFDFLGWDYGDPIPDLIQYKRIIMCDISFPIDEMFKISDNLIYIDHHISSINEFNNRLTGVYGLRDTNVAACELTWKYFFPSEPMPEIVRLLGRYDCLPDKELREHPEHMKIREFQYGARQYISNYEEAYNALYESILDIEIGRTNLDESIVNQIWSKGIAIYQYLCTEAKQTYNKAFEIELKNPNYTPDNEDIFISYGFLCVNQERFNPVNFGIDYHKDGYDGFACFWYKEGKWMWSLYNDNGKVDCSAIAKQFGGGGHKGAAGFVCNNKTMLKIIK